MKTSKQGIALITQYEGLKLEAYKCTSGIWTVGYGHTGPDVVQGTKITQAQADELLAKDLAKFENCVNANIKSKLTQNQFDSCVSLAYNIGCSAFAKSTLCRLINADPNDKAIEQQFLAWNKSKGIVSRGLVNRRVSESQNYFKV